ncbi:CYTH domain-containing protein [Rhizobium laguerreae]|uniref:CYTH domain-containing protein n=1 Tax=Rhizobium laguerreae TaxID=1076926 RepID=UPI001C90608B|nr:CYTH domain-containing protein [Rhizobium laguerreae]MBY3155279.1 CYTH domain-containing protein [Rhizobium laguerreae]
MAKEIERKFKVSGEAWRDEVLHSYLIEQAYLVAERERSVRVRIRTLLTDDGSAEPECFLTMKFGATAISTDEYEYRIPFEDARSLVAHAGDLTLTKVRHLVEFDGRTWEVDEFRGRHGGLVVAEIESDDAESINNFPAWVGTEVTYDSYFKNASLVLPK